MTVTLRLVIAASQAAVASSAIEAVLSTAASPTVRPRRQRPGRYSAPAALATSPRARQSRSGHLRRLRAMCTRADTTSSAGLRLFVVVVRASPGARTASTNSTPGSPWSAARSRAASATAGRSPAGRLTVSVTSSVLLLASSCNPLSCRGMGASRAARPGTDRGDPAQRPHRPADQAVPAGLRPLTLVESAGDGDGRGVADGLAEAPLAWQERRTRSTPRWRAATARTAMAARAGAERAVARLIGGGHVRPLLVHARARWPTAAGSGRRSRRRPEPRSPGCRSSPGAAAATPPSAGRAVRPPRR
jgi:hypothetical protein